MAIDSVSLTLLVDNVDQAVDFYVNRLGLFKTEPERVSVLITLDLARESSCFSLSLCDVSSDPGLRAFVGNQCGDATFLAIPIDDIEEMEIQLEQSDVTIVDRYELPYAEWLLVMDPFGNKIALCENFCHS